MSGYYFLPTLSAICMVVSSLIGSGLLYFFGCIVMTLVIFMQITLLGLMDTHDVRLSPQNRVFKRKVILLVSGRYPTPKKFVWAMTLHGIYFIAGLFGGWFGGAFMFFFGLVHFIFYDLSVKRRRDLPM